MILQRLMSEASRIPDVASEVYGALNEYNDIEEPKSLEDLEKLHVSRTRQFQVETMRRTHVDLKSVEVNLIKAKHAITDDGDDFV